MAKTSNPDHPHAPPDWRAIPYKTVHQLAERNPFTAFADTSIARSEPQATDSLGLQAALIQCPPAPSAASRFS
ncbi:MAG: hypothetical protein FD124_1728 [Alphaproteobacteria bacterium]|nr:MAG: hypothetical protein FD160_809 [Caulobacteraceae bacterium]TPW06434.1 MAG: hypothetical protein FD124_1728 [Alphaproteobacteria bacterium]